MSSAHKLDTMIDLAMYALQETFGAEVMPESLYVDDSDNKVVVHTLFTTPPCVVCGASSEMMLPVHPLVAWRTGTLVQEAFPDFDAGARELLVTGVHWSCWDTLGGEDDG